MCERRFDSEFGKQNVDKTAVLECSVPSELYSYVEVEGSSGLEFLEFHIGSGDIIKKVNEVSRSSKVNSSLKGNISFEKTGGNGETYCKSWDVKTTGGLLEMDAMEVYLELTEALNGSKVHKNLCEVDTPDTQGSIVDLKNYTSAILMTDQTQPLTCFMMTNQTSPILTEDTENDVKKDVAERFKKISKKGSKGKGC